MFSSLLGMGDRPWPALVLQAGSGHKGAEEHIGGALGSCWNGLEPNWEGG